MLGSQRAEVGAYPARDYKGAHRAWEYSRTAFLLGAEGQGTPSIQRTVGTGLVFSEISSSCSQVKWSFVYTGMFVFLSVLS